MSRKRDNRIWNNMIREFEGRKISEWKLLYLDLFVFAQTTIIMVEDKEQLTSEGITFYQSKNNDFTYSEAKEFVKDHEHLFEDKDYIKMDIKLTNEK